MDKRGVSQIVTTILIILLVLAAIVIVWQAVKGMVERGAGTITSQAQCMGIDLNIVTADATANKVEVTRLAGGDADAVKDVRFLVNGTARTHSLADPELGPLETKTYTGITLDVGDEVEIAPVLSDDAVCNVVASKTAA